MAEHFRPGGSISYGVGVIAAISRRRGVEGTFLAVRLRADRVTAAMGTAMAVGLGRFAFQHSPARFQRYKGLVKLGAPGSQLGDLFLNVTYCTFEIVHLAPVEATKFSARIPSKPPSRRNLTIPLTSVSVN